MVKLMPTFPVYEGELPDCLNPLNPRHYWLLAYWIFFRTTALKYYLYQADPELYKTEGGVGDFLKSFASISYRNLYAVSILLPFLISFLVGIPFIFLTDASILHFNPQVCEASEFLGDSIDRSLCNGILWIFEEPGQWSQWSS